MQFECDECVGVVPRKRLLDPPVPSVGDECRVEWNGDEYTAKVLAMGDEQQARNGECEYLKTLDHDPESEHQPPAKKRRLLKKKKTSATNPKNKSGQNKSKPVAAKAKKSKQTDFVLDLGSPTKEVKEKDGNQPEKKSEVQGSGQELPQTEPERSEKQAGQVERTEQPQQTSEEHQALSPLSLSSSSGDDYDETDEVFIGLTTPKKVIIHCNCVLCTCTTCT